MKNCCLSIGCLNIRGTYVTANIGCLNIHETANIGCLNIYETHVTANIGCLNIQETYVTANNSTNSNILSFDSNLKIVYYNNY